MLHEVAEEKFPSPFFRPSRTARQKHSAHDALSHQRRVRVQRLLKQGIGGKALSPRPAIVGARHELIHLLKSAPADIREEHPFSLRLRRQSERIPNAISKDRPILPLTQKRVVLRNGAVLIQAKNFS